MISSNHPILCRPLLLPSLFSSIRIFSYESALHIKGPKYWSFSFSISPSNEYSGLIYLKINWFDLLAVQGILKSIFQHHNLKVSILQCSAFFIYLSVLSVICFIYNGMYTSVPISQFIPPYSFPSPVNISLFFTSVRSSSSLSGWWLLSGRFNEMRPGVVS